MTKVFAHWDLGIVNKTVLIGRKYTAIKRYAIIAFSKSKVFDESWTHLHSV
jgi:hypothetical protein